MPMGRCLLVCASTYILLVGSGASLQRHQRACHFRGRYLDSAVVVRSHSGSVDGILGVMTGISGTRPLRVYGASES